jgi:RNA polymerase sigma factor (sigma-70 family)
MKVQSDHFKYLPFFFARVVVTQVQCAVRWWSFFVLKRMKWDTGFSPVYNYISDLYIDYYSKPSHIILFNIFVLHPNQIMIQNQYLWLHFLEGDKNAMSEIFLQFHDDLFRYGVKLAGDENLVKDSIQDLFLKLWKNRTNLKPVENLKPYLFKSLRNHIIDSLELRKSTVSIENDFEHSFEVVYSTEDFLINSQVTKDTRKQIIDALNQLMPRQREAIYLRYFEELDFDTIATVMDMNVQSARNLLHRGISALREKMLLWSFFVLLGKASPFFPDFY